MSPAAIVLALFPVYLLVKGRLPVYFNMMFGDEK